MTLLSAVSFFDESNRWMGYTLASDDIMGVTNLKHVADPSKVEERFSSEKSFHGSNFMGLFSGAIITPGNSSNHKENIRLARAALNNQFNNISDGRDYNSLPALKGQPKDLSLLIASRHKNGRFVELFQLRQWSRDGWIARRLHVGSPATYKKEKTSTLWFSPVGDEELEYVSTKLQEKLDPINAQKMARGIIINPRTNENYEELQGYRADKANLYYVDPVQHGKIEKGRLVQLN